jgi:hypothetical protein
MPKRQKKRQKKQEHREIPYEGRMRSWRNFDSGSGPDPENKKKKNSKRTQKKIKKKLKKQQQRTQKKLWRCPGNQCRVHCTNCGQVKKKSHKKKSNEIKTADQNEHKEKLLGPGRCGYLQSCTFASIACCQRSASSVSE